MQIHINDTVYELAQHLTVVEALQQIGVAQLKGTAIAVNNQVIPRSTWATYQLNDGDNVLLIQATQGG